jgi:DNA replication protein DnaC
MLIHPTLEKLKTLRLLGMAKALVEQLQRSDFSEWSFEDRLGLLVDREAAEKENRRLQTRLRQAKLAQAACVEDLDLKARRGLDRTLVAKLVACDWIGERLNVIATGPTDLPTLCSPHKSPVNRGYSISSNSLCGIRRPS